MRSFPVFLLVKERRQRRALRRERGKRTLRAALSGLLAAILLAAAFASIAFAFLYAELTRDLPPVDALPVLLDAQTGTLLQPTRLYDRSGQVVIHTLENPGITRRYLSLDHSLPESLSPFLAEAVVALQDPGFFQRSGLRISALGEHSASTIPEILVEDLLLYDEPAGLIKTLRLRILADQVLVRYGHTQVLEWYLNSANFGHMAYGADSAARLYLGKPASQLSLAEAALLAAVLKTPALNPLDAPAAAVERQREVLLALFEAGMIDEQQFVSAVNSPLSFAGPPAEPASLALAFSNLAIDQLAQSIDRSRIERGGLRIITSLDYELQLQLGCTLQAQLARLSDRPNAPGQCDAARLLPSLPLALTARSGEQAYAASAVILDAGSAEVLALVGDTTLNGEPGTLLQHAAGSLQTPVLALASFARSLNPASLLWDIPTAGIDFSNPDGRFHGPVRLRTALANDYLVPLTQTLLQIGAAPLVNTAQLMGLSNFRVPADVAETFYRGAQLDPLAVAHAFSVFSNLGLLHGLEAGGDLSPILVLQVSGLDGQPVSAAPQRQTRVVASAPLAYLVHHVLADESARWPSLGYPNALEIGRPAGAKVGQADGGLSTWTAGYTRQVVGAVWLGVVSPDPSSQGPGIQPAAGIWHALMQYISRDQPQQNWEMPAGISQVEVCDPSGLRPTADCPNVVSEVFLSGNEPAGFDTLYRRFQINRETGRLATVFTPPELVEERTYLVTPPEAQEWSRLANLPLPPQDYDVVQAPLPNPNANISTPTQFSYVRGEVALLGTAAGEDFISYQLQAGQGINPLAWVSITEPRTQPVQNGRLGLWDTAGMDGLYVLRLLVLRQDQQVETAVLQVTVDNTPPVVRIPYPQQNQEFTLTSQRTLTLQVEVEENFSIQRVEWWLNGRKIGERFETPFVLVWNAAAGEHRLQARAFDSAGNEGASPEVHFTVR